MQQVKNVPRDSKHEILKIYSTICKHEVIEFFIKRKTDIFFLGIVNAESFFSPPIERIKKMMRKACRYNE